MYYYVEEISYVVLFAIIFFVVHLQFKYCIPTALLLLKLLETSIILLSVKLYIYVRLQNNDISNILPSWEEIARLYNDVVTMAAEYQTDL